MAINFLRVVQHLQQELDKLRRKHLQLHNMLELKLQPPIVMVVLLQLIQLVEKLAQMVLVLIHILDMVLVLLGQI